MPLLRSIEIANFCNATRPEPWTPTWVYERFELNCVSAAFNIPNGKGKTTLCETMLATLLAHGHTLSRIRSIFFAPRKSGHLTHIRMEFKVETTTEQFNDLAAQGGADVGGESLVVGIYGNSGESDRYSLYAYHGTFDDCPIGTKQRTTRHRVSDTVFLDSLKKMPGLFPRGHAEQSNRAFAEHMAKFFDVANLTQQFKYQASKGAEGAGGYFDVKPVTGMDYSAAIFYERLAPELLVDVMGDQGDADEHGIEDTIIKKAQGVIKARFRTNQTKKELDQAEYTLKEFGAVASGAIALIESEKEYDHHRRHFSVELSAYRRVLFEAPLPGVPRLPGRDVPAIAQMLVFQDIGPNNVWHLPDRALGEFTGEGASAVNQRAERQLASDMRPVDRKMQAIDIACDLARPGGHAAKLYNCAKAIALVGTITKFAGDWTRERATAAIQATFDWADQNAVTNPARLRQAEREETKRRREVTKDDYKRELVELNSEQEVLAAELTARSTEQSAFEMMRQSGLFTAVELANPQQTGQTVMDVVTEASKALTAHTTRVASLTEIHHDWQSFVTGHPNGERPGELAAAIEATRKAAGTAHGDASRELKGYASTVADRATKALAAKTALDKATARVAEVDACSTSKAFYEANFGNTSPHGLEGAVQSELSNVRKQRLAAHNEVAAFRKQVAARQEFRKRHGDLSPKAWIEAAKSAYQEATGARVGAATAVQQATNRRAALDHSVVAPGPVSASVTAALKDGQIQSRSLYQVVGDLKLLPERAARVLTYFSAMLHSPVLPDIQTATEAAAHLADQKIEAPVFVAGELEAFARHGEIKGGPGVAHTWLLGVRTRPVDCLLDPGLVEQEKRDADEEIVRLEASLLAIDETIARYAPTTEEWKLAADAEDCEANDHESYVAARDAIIKDADERLPGLENRASTDVVNAIRDRVKLAALLQDCTEADIREAAAAAADMKKLADEEKEAAEKQLEVLREKVNDAAQALQKATEQEVLVPQLRRVQAYMDHETDNPVFMDSRDEALTALQRAADEADKRRAFDFAGAARFLSATERNRPEWIQVRLKEITDAKKEANDSIIKLDRDIDELMQQMIALEQPKAAIDDVVRTLIREYVVLQRDEEFALPISEDLVDNHVLVGMTAAIRDGYSMDEQIRLTMDLRDHLEVVDKNRERKTINSARTKFQTAKSNLEIAIGRLRDNPMSGVEQHVLLRLAESVGAPKVVLDLFEAVKANTEKNRVANQIAENHLNKEWEDIGDFLHQFTRRLPDNLSIMQRCFGPKIDGATGEVLRAGFEISAKIAPLEDVKAILGRIVGMVELHEQQSRQAQENGFADLRAADESGLKHRVRHEFYRAVVLIPRIHVRMPSISHRKLLLEREMVSSGQKIAMTLLWIIRLADFVRERELERETVSSAQKARRRAAKSYFVLIDGAFSHLSEKRLISDALEGILSTRGTLQLIITGHDPAYKNDFKYFPTLIVGRPIGDRYMHADCETRRLAPGDIDAEQVGGLETMTVQTEPVADA